MFTLMDLVHSTITSHIKQAIVSYQNNERLQDFIDYVQRKVCLFILLPLCFLFMYRMITYPEKLPELYVETAMCQIYVREIIVTGENDI